MLDDKYPINYLELGNILNDLLYKFMKNRISEYIKINLIDDVAQEFCMNNAEVYRDRFDSVEAFIDNIIMLLYS